jgi:ArsR family transcriptional regulator
MQFAARSLPVREVSRLFKTLGDETRLRMVALLSHGELCVCHIEEALGISQPNASRHLALLRAAGLVDTRRVGTWIYYRLATQADPTCDRQLRWLIKEFGRADVLRADVERLLKTGPDACK